MTRFAPELNNAETHPEALTYLTDLMIGVVKMMDDINYQPFTVERLNEWHKTHRKDISSCADYTSNMVKRISNDLIPEHLNTLHFFNTVVFDLKLIALGQMPIHPFDEERIKEANKHFSEIANCRKIDYSTDDLPLHNLASYG